MRRHGIVVALLLAASLLTGAGANAATTWKGFGNATVSGRGESRTAPDIWIPSVTNKNPTAVRYQVTNGSAQRRVVFVDWEVKCWNVNKSGNPVNEISDKGQDTYVMAPRATITRSPLKPSGRAHCSVEIRADHGWNNDFDSVGRPGTLTVKLQAKY